jgi:alpha-D-ribose 1-methylphosphonate 5-triphosphate synthase subunit PhnG
MPCATGEPLHAGSASMTNCELMRIENKALVGVQYVFGVDRIDRAYGL